MTNVKKQKKLVEKFLTEKNKKSSNNIFQKLT